MKKTTRQLTGNHFSVALVLVSITTLYIVAANIGPIATGMFFCLFLIGVGFYIQKRISLLAFISLRLGDQNTDEVSSLKNSVSELRAALTILIGISAAILLNIALWQIFGQGFLATEALKIRDIVLFNYNEYLFFIGSSVGLSLLFSRRKFLLGTFLISLGFAWVIYHKSFADFLALVGVDSLSELNDFSITEAKFWISTAGQIFQPNLNYKVLVFYALMSVLLIWPFRKFLGVSYQPRRKSCATGIGLSLALMTVPSYMVLHDPFLLFMDNSKSFALTKGNFSGSHGISVKADNSKIDVLVYIGESTSIMNMGIYGYPRKTTPELERIGIEDDGLIRFDKVLATHTHTAWSLLEAFSVGLDESENYLPINYRKRVPLVDLLNDAGVKTVLISNQGSSGTWNQASSIIFGKTERHFSVDSKLLGNSDYRLNRPWDHLFFKDYFSKIASSSGAEKNITFFHSYAGHGPYLDNIPPDFRNKVDNLLENHPEAMLTGKLSGHLPNIDAYDSAIRYVDYSVSEAIKFAKGRESPTVLIYFSDHGDSVYGGRGHDSTRFVHEMARVPFLVYFNESAKRDHRVIYSKYKKMALSNEVSTLAQLPNTILDIVGVKINTYDDTAPNRNKLIGEPLGRFPIAIRELSNAISYVNIDNTEVAPPGKYKNNFIDVTDYATRYMANWNMDAKNKFNICYHASNTFAKTLRGRLVASCLEADFFVEESGDVNIYHPPLRNIGYKADNFLTFAKGKSIWVDAKNPTTQKNCMALANLLIANKESVATILVEFPTGSHRYQSELAGCAKRLKDEGIKTSYYIPTELAVSCAKRLIGGLLFDIQEACTSLYNDVNLAHQSKLYTDISFDYNGIDSIMHMPFVKNYSLNTWNVMPQNLGKISPERFRNIILNNDDPNSP